MNSVSRILQLQDLSLALSLPLPLSLPLSKDEGDSRGQSGKENPENKVREDKRVKEGVRDEEEEAKRRGLMEERGESDGKAPRNEGSRGRLRVARGNERVGWGERVREGG